MKEEARNLLADILANELEFVFLKEEYFSFIQLRNVMKAINNSEKIGNVSIIEFKDEEKIKFILSSLLKNNTVNQLGFINCELEDQVFFFLDALLERNSEISRLEITDCKLDMNGLSFFLRSDRPKNLNFLALNNIFSNMFFKELFEVFDDDYRNYFLFFIQKFVLKNNIKILMLANNQLELDDLHYLRLALEGNEQLVGLFLQYNNFNNEAVKRLGELLFLSRTLKIFDVSYNNFGYEGALSLFQYLQYNTDLREIIIKDFDKIQFPYFKENKEIFYLYNYFIHFVYRNSFVLNFGLGEKIDRTVLGRAKNNVELQKNKIACLISQDFPEEMKGFKRLITECLITDECSKLALFDRNINEKAKVVEVNKRIKEYKSKLYVSVLLKEGFNNFLNSFLLALELNGLNDELNVHSRESLLSILVKGYEKNPFLFELSCLENQVSSTFYFKRLREGRPLNNYRHELEVLSKQLNLSVSVFLEANARICYNPGMKHRIQLKMEDRKIYVSLSKKTLSPKSFLWKKILSQGKEYNYNFMFETLKNNVVKRIKVDKKVKWKQLS